MSSINKANEQNNNSKIDIQITYEGDIQKSLDVFKRENIDVDLVIQKVLQTADIFEKLPGIKKVDVTITDPETIQQINREYRGIDKATDVLSFPMEDPFALTIQDDNFEYILGDIVLNLDRIIFQANEYETGLLRELTYMVVHSFYHLLGYDHIDPEDKKVMRKKEDELLNAIFESE